MTRSLLIDRLFPGGIRIRRVSGTNDPKTHKAILAMLDMLVRKGRLYHLVQTSPAGQIFTVLDERHKPHLSRAVVEKTMRGPGTDYEL